MASGKYSFTIEQGTTVDFEIQWTDSGSNKIDLAHYEASMNIKDTYGGTSIITLSSSIGNDYSAVKQKSGSAFLSVSGSDCSTPTASGSLGVYIGYSNTSPSILSEPEYIYDIELTNVTTEKRTRLIEGSIHVTKEVTTNNPA